MSPNPPGLSFSNAMNLQDPTGDLLLANGALDMKKYLLACALVLACAPAQAGWLDFWKADAEKYPFRDRGPERAWLIVS
jgi:hypothetical protein